MTMYDDKGQDTNGDDGGDDDESGFETQARQDGFALVVAPSVGPQRLLDGLIVETGVYAAACTESIPRPQRLLDGLIVETRPGARARWGW